MALGTTSMLTRRVARAAVVAVATLGLLTGTIGPDITPAAAATRSRFFHFNMAGNTWHHGNIDPVVPAVVRSLKDFKPVGVSLNEVCRNQFRAIKRRLRQGETRWRMRGTWTQTSGSGNDCPGDHYGIAVLTRNPVLSRRVWELPNTGQTERRKLLCAKTTIRRRISRMCTTHIAPDGSGPRARQIRKVARKVNPWVADGRPLVLGGDFNATPSYGPLDRLYSPAYPEGRGRFKEVDGPDGCRCGEPTHSTGKIDYLFVSARHFGGVWGDATYSSVSDHNPLRGSARLR